MPTMLLILSSNLMWLRTTPAFEKLGLKKFLQLCAPSMIP